MGWVEKFVDPRESLGPKGADGSRLSAQELVEQKAFVPLLLSESKCWEGREKGSRKAWFLQCCSTGDTSWRPSYDKSILVTFGISLVTLLFV